MKTMTTEATRWTIRRGADRGLADHDWLRSQHTFSFADYHDPAQMGFRTLRVINEDRVAPGQGFGTHPHRDMEIFSYVLEGALEHRDSMGNGSILRPGQVQLMSAGRGVTHSEFNPSPTEAAHFLQIWILPRARGLTPSYTEWHPTTQQEQQPFVLLISPDGRNGSATIQQDASVYRVRLKAGESVRPELGQGRGAWVQVMRGTLTVDGQRLTAGDGARTDVPGVMELSAESPAEALWFDLA